MATIETIYTGGLRTKAKHVRSGNEIITDAPVDNQGKGEAFSPTDLVAGALASCMLTIIGIKARDHGFSIDGTETTVKKIMADKPRRIAEVQIEFVFPPNNYTDKEKKLIINSAKTCPVAKSLHPDIKQLVTFTFQ